MEEEGEDRWVGGREAAGLKIPSGCHPVRREGGDC